MVDPGLTVIQDSIGSATPENTGELIKFSHANNNNKNTHSREINVSSTVCFLQLGYTEGHIVRTSQSQHSHCEVPYCRFLSRVASFTVGPSLGPRAYLYYVVCPIPLSYSPIWSTYLYYIFSCRCYTGTPKGGFFTVSQPDHVIFLPYIPDS